MNASDRADHHAQTRTHGHSSAQLMLTRLTVAFSRRRAYPATHPLLIKAEEQAYDAMCEVLAAQRTLSIAIARNSLLLDDVALDSAHSVARELSDRLRLRGVGGLTFDSSATAESLRQAINWIAVDPSSVANGPDGADLPPPLAGIKISRIDYGRLSLGDHGDVDAMSVDDIWRELASGLSLDDEISAAGAEDTQHVFTEGVERRLVEPDAARRAGAVLLRVADQVTRVGYASRAVLAERLQTVLATLQSSSLRSVIGSCGAAAEKRQFIAHMIDALPAQAIVEWLENAARATGEPLSPQILRVLSSLLARARAQGQQQDGHDAFRSAARNLVQAWSLDDPESTEHTGLLDRISAFDTSYGTTEVSETGASRLVQFALEIDMFGDDATDATSALLADGHVAELLSWSATAPGTHAAAAVRRLLAAPAVVNAVLLRDPLDQVMARSLLASLDDSARDLLLDALRDANSRTARRLILGRLRECGASLEPLLLVRMTDAPWYFARNLLTLLRDIVGTDVAVTGVATNIAPDKIRTIALQQLTEHQHEHVRLEATRILLADASTRETAIRRALDDPADRVILLALETLASQELPARVLLPNVVKRLLRIIESETLSVEARTRAIKLLSHVPANAIVRDVLLTLATVRTRILRRIVLADVNPLTVAALEVLATRYSADEYAAPVIEIASKSNEKRVREAVVRLPRLAALA